MPDPFTIGFAEDFLLADGRLAFPDYDLGPLRGDPRLRLARVPARPVHAAADLAGIDVLVSVPTTTAVTSESLDPAGRLCGIVRVGVGCDDVDVGACTAGGVAVITPSQAVQRPTAVAALALILAVTNRLVEKDRLTRDGPAAWPGRAFLRGRNLQGLTLGLLGCGSIGSELATLVQPLGLRVIAHDPALSPDVGIAGVDLATLLAEADVLSIHCPLTDATRHLVDSAALAAMKPDAILINTARGGIVDHLALANALIEGRIGGAGLDVFHPEPLPPGHPLLSAPNVTFSAHALNWTVELDADLARANVAAVYDLLEGRLPQRLMNPEVLENPRFIARRAEAARRITL
jgi:phosphoglycerate dehydrogenase-like enzyme